MLTKGPAKRVTIFINEDARHHVTPLHDAIMTYLMQKGVAGATATRAFSGFGGHHTLHTPKIEVLAEHLPLRIEFVETPEKVEEVLPTLYEMVADGLIEVQDTTVVKLSQNAAAPAPVRKRTESTARQLQVFLGDADKWHGEPLHESIVKKLRMMGVDGATIFRGLERRIMISVIDSPEKIAEASAAIESMLPDGQIVTSDVSVVNVGQA